MFSKFSENVPPFCNPCDLWLGCFTGIHGCNALFSANWQPGLLKYGSFSQDCDHAFHCHRQHKSLKVLYIYIKCMYNYNIILGIVSSLHHITKKYKINGHGHTFHSRIIGCSIVFHKTNMWSTFPEYLQMYYGILRFSNVKNDIQHF